MTSDSRPQFTWKCKDREIELGLRTQIMAVLNVTPDSFSDGGRYIDADKAVSHALAMQQQGAHIIDVGGESSRPGAEPVSEEEELRRVIPVIENLASAGDCLISIDTVKSKVADEALKAGAHIINDISGLSFDEAMPDVASAHQAGVVIMHMQGTPQTMQRDPNYKGECAAEIANYLVTRAKDLESKGLDRDQLVLDPGIGFGKTVDDNLNILHNLKIYNKMGYPLLIGLSRKSFIGKILGSDIDDRLIGSIAGLSASILNGAHIMRVHDVKESVDAANIVDRILEGKEKT